MSILSLIIPVYNTERYLERCLDSILKQSYAQIEVIVVDDCSPGNTDEIIEKYKGKFFSLKYLKHEKNRGLFLARLTGYRHATGDFIAFLDSDDYVTRDFYRKLICKAEEEDADIVIGRTVIEKLDGSHWIYNFQDVSLRFPTICGHEAVRAKFWEQEGLCYSWHTIWNKIYRKNLWEQGIRYFEKINTHVIMTEDIAFSSVIFYFANRVASVDNDGYFYCENENASTNSSNIPIKKFSKNLQDIITVFDFVKDFLESQSADETIMAHYNNFRKYYAKMWKNHAQTTYSGADKGVAFELIEELQPGLREEVQYEDHFFNTQMTAWNGGLEYAKDLIADKRFDWISFDIFDTLVVRPLYRPEDVFAFLDPMFHELMKTGASFKRIRINGEKLAREKWGKIHPKAEDLVLDEIYRVIGEAYDIPEAVTQKMMNLEIKLEKEMLAVRGSGKELFDFSVALGKNIVLTSDMYLSKSTITEILEQFGYKGYKHLFLSSDIGLTKNTGSLFRHVLNSLKIKGEQLLHIGDTWSNDIERPQALGIQTFFLPKTKDAMENKIQGIQTNMCATIGDYACSDIVERKKYKNSMGYGVLHALAANRYFDNPYRYFNGESDFNKDPYFIGYYPLGMHLLGFVRWLIEESQAYGYKKLYFTSRDGYLPMLAYNRLRRVYPDAPIAEYLYTSRKALMPYILANPYDFYDMPVEITNHSPQTLMSILTFCIRDGIEKEFSNILKENKINSAACFKNREQYKLFISLFLTYAYDPTKHKKAKELCSSYYACISEGAAAVDMGYSGRIQGAISEAAGRGIDVFFVHSDDKQYQMESRKHGFRIHTFYDFSPCMTGMIREHIFSSFEPSCVGFKRENGGITEPVFETEAKSYQDKFIVQKIHDGALEFIDDFIRIFGAHYEELPLKPIEISYPYEGFLRYMKQEDLKIFDASFFEDTVYGAREKLKISDFLHQQLVNFDMTNDVEAVGVNVSSFSETLLERMRGKSRFLKFVVYLAADKENFKTRLWFELQNRPVIFKICRKVYRVFLK